MVPLEGMGAAVGWALVGVAEQLPTQTQNSTENSEVYYDAVLHSCR
jgi:hypothetical protein